MLPVSNYPIGGTKVKYLSTAKAKQLIREAVAEFPERRNPQCDGGSCLYTAEDDPTVHCIAGEVIHRAGLPTKFLVEGKGFSQRDADKAGEWRIGREYVNKGYMHWDTVFLLGNVQYKFDSATHDGRSWVSALNDCVRSGLL